MMYYAVDYIGNLRQISRKQFIKDNMLTSAGNGREMVIAYKDDHYLLMTDSTNSVEVIKHAILEMLQPYISFDID